MKPNKSNLAILKQICQLIPSHIVNKLAKKHGIKPRKYSAWSHVVTLLYSQLSHALSLNDVCDGLNNHLNIIQLSFKKEDLLKLYNNFPSFDTNNILKTSLNISSDFFKSDLKTARYIDFKISLEGDLLTKVDRASMLNSLECRAPLLDYKLANFSYSIPDKFLIKFGNKKRIFKDTFDYLLPKNYLNSPKSGFEVPIGDWIKNEIKNDFLETLSKENLSQHSFFNISYINLLIDQHLSTQTDHSWKLWTLYCFQKWYNSIFNV